MLTPTIVVGCVSVKLNDHMAVGASQALALCSIWEPNGSLMRFILDESHQKEVITYHFLSVVQLQLLTLRLYRLSQVETNCLVPLAMKLIVAQFCRGKDHEPLKAQSVCGQKMRCSFCTTTS